MHIVKEMLQLTHAIYKSVISFKTIECSENVHSIVGKRLCAGGRSYELFGYPDSRNQFSGHRNFSSDCDLGRILFYETVLAGFPCGRGDLPRTFCMLRTGNAVGILGCTFLWSIQELYEQEERVKKGWFPENSNRQK
jgi:hypothetical protein